MLLLDKVDAVHLGESAVGIKNVTINEPFFPGHFPVKPLMPGVLIIEAMAQTAAVLVLKTLNVSSNNSLVYFMSVIEAKFRKPVVPGDTLRLHVEKIQNRGNVWRFKGQAKVEGDLHAEAIFTAMIVEK
jgi:3-hydroxyacyl-[acyl-carrier-protein] dehydratase